jgi:hypothetical protein
VLHTLLTGVMLGVVGQLLVAPLHVRLEVHPVTHLHTPYHKSVGYKQEKVIYDQQPNFCCF